MSSSFSQRHPHLGKLIPQKSSRRPSPNPAADTPAGATAGTPPRTIGDGNPGPQRAGGGSVDNAPHDPASQPSRTAVAATSDVASTKIPVLDTDALQLARDALWKRAYVQLQTDEVELVTAYEKLIADQNALGDQPVLTPENVSIVVQNQKTRMDGRKWTYPWFGRNPEVRDTVDSILKVVERSAGLISTGMKLAPVYVSLPWSFVAILIPFIMNDSKELNAALSGLKDVTSIMSSYSYAEKAFLTDDATKADFEDIACKVYTAILEYQAAAAVYFAKSTLKRLGLSLAGMTSWTDAFAKVEIARRYAQDALGGLDAQVMRRGFESTTAMLQKGVDLMKQMHHDISSQIGVSAAQLKRESVLNWICADNVAQDHFNVEDKVGKEYLGSGSWLLEDSNTFLPWLQSKNETLILQGMVGSGKSSLTCMVINHLVASSNSQIAFAYFSSSVTSDDQDGDKQRPRSRTRDYIRRILKQCAYDSDGNLAKSVEQEYDKSSDHSAGGWNLNLSSAVQQLQSALEAHSKESFTFVFDALDECPNLTEFLDSLITVFQASPNLKLFMSGRLEVEPPTQLKPRYAKIDIANTADIASYVEHEVSRRHQGSNWTVEQADRLKGALIRYAGGMFRWVELELDLFLPRSSYLSRQQMGEDIDARLLKLENAQFEPLTRLYDAYQEIWRNALGGEDETARRAVIKCAIIWALCAIRPLDMYELIQAASTTQNGTTYKISADMLFGYCSNLITLDSINDVRLSHVSVKQFFEEKMAYEFAPKLQHQHAFEICMSTLPLEPAFNSWVFETPDFKGYCFWNWPQHYLHGSPVSLRARVLSKRVELNSRLRAFLQHLYDVHDRNTQQLELPDKKLTNVLREQEQTEASLLMVTERLLATLARTPDFIIDPIIIRRLVGAVCLHVTILNQFGLDAIDLAFVLGTELVLKHFMNGPEQTGRAANDEVHQYLYKGYFDRTDRVSKYLSNDVTVVTPILNEHTERSLMRPKIIFEEDTKALDRCAFCHITKWVEGSRAGESFDFVSSYNYFDNSDSLGCALCKAGLEALTTEVGDSADRSRDPVKIHAILDVDADWIRKSGRDVLRYFIPKLGHGDLELCLAVDDDTPPTAMELFRGRMVDPEDFGQIISWQQECNSHELCRAESYIEDATLSVTVPTRLIEIDDEDGKPVARLRESASLSAQSPPRFVILSFTWGGTKPRFMLSKANLMALITAIPMDELSTLHKDAIVVCWKLGYRYLWIDALCILQDDGAGWESEVLNMGTYLASADLVMAASAGSTKDPLIPAGRGSFIKSFRAHLEGDETHHFTVGVRKPLQSVEDILNQSILSRRWRIQEAVLPRRLLIFGKDQIHWVCPESLASQSTTLRQPTPLTAFPTILQRVEQVRSTGSETSVREFTNDYWFYIAEMSSGGQLAVPSDALPALAGVATNMQRLTGETYLSGLWLEDLNHGLLWIKQKPSVAKRRASGIATWTWASDTAPISYALVAGLRAFAKQSPGIVEITHSGKEEKIDEIPTATRRRWVSDILHLILNLLMLFLIGPLKRILEVPRKPASIEPKDDFLLRLLDYDTGATDGQHRTPLNAYDSDTLWQGIRSLRISAYSKRAASLDSSTLDGFEYFFDYEYGPGRSVKVADTFLAAVSPWQYTAQGDARWAGLMLEKVDEDSEVYERRGVFIGPRVEQQLHGWARETLILR